MKTYINIEHAGTNYYIVFTDYKGNKIDVSKPYKTLKACKAEYNKCLTFSWIKERKAQ